MNDINNIYNDSLLFDIPKEYQNFSGIYKITNNKTKYIYIGRTKNFLSRYKQHVKTFNHNTTNCKFKYLRTCFESIEFKMQLLEITTNIIQRETYYIKKYNTVKNGLNVLKNDDDIMFIFNHQLNPKTDRIFKDKTLIPNFDKLKYIEEQVPHNKKHKFKNKKIAFIKTKLALPEFQQFLAENGFSTNNKTFYIKQDKFIKVSKKEFINLLLEKNIV